MWRLIIFFSWEQIDYVSSTDKNKTYVRVFFIINLTERFINCKLVTLVILNFYVFLDSQILHILNGFKPKRTWDC